MLEYISLGGAIILGTGIACAITGIAIAVIELIRYVRN